MVALWRARPGCSILPHWLEALLGLLADDSDALGSVAEADGTLVGRRDHRPTGGVEVFTGSAVTAWLSDSTRPGDPAWCCGASNGSASRAPSGWPWIVASGEVAAFRLWEELGFTWQPDHLRFTRYFG